MQAPDRRDRRAGQRDVDAVGDQPGVELGGGELAAARLDQRVERLARLVGGPADGAALLGRQLGHRAQQQGQLGLAAEEADPEPLELLRRGRRTDRGLALAAQLLDAVDHASPILLRDSS